jgi:hypothetical protein
VRVAELELEIGRIRGGAGREGDAGDVRAGRGVTRCVTSRVGPVHDGLLSRCPAVARRQIQPLLLPPSLNLAQEEFPLTHQALVAPMISNPTAPRIGSKLVLMFAAT